MTCQGRSGLLNLVLMIRQNYRTLCSEEIEETDAHIASSDYPEEEQWMLATARECGFSLARPWCEMNSMDRGRSWRHRSAPGEAADGSRTRCCHQQDP